jgi:23S rRNA pseudouridine2605 synthase
MQPSKPTSEEPVEGMRLNKYIAHCGLASRRGAADIIKNGKVKVDGKVILDIGYRVLDGQVVTFNDKKVTPEVNKVYVLINKPKGYITTVKDERGRKTVMDILGGKVAERIYPVGRLDRNTCGLLLMTNDGDLAKKLSHPSHEVKKIYRVFLDKNVKSSDLEKLKAGVTLEDGTTAVDSANYINGVAHSEVGIELHSGKNRIIRRLFEHLGYEVKRLDRVYYAGLTKKDLSRGWFRHLTRREVIMLKHFS